MHYMVVDYWTNMKYYLHINLFVKSPHGTNGRIDQIGTNNGRHVYDILTNFSKAC